ncbi:pectinesterase [Amborella trichopoda]|uniref:Pectinesterase n=1 Tax=Amborella trichopoda TaxID=13333 RepID=W1P6G7_AMBTC|nr:pectinesterase [Amborella trichopoda]ERN03161.1 hypothetical protein AMTR_s00003p00120050 [Amborella trichopoda]|eukprot:XP_006841486.1 pectinesterase [Amborella trichopoda]
MAKRLRSIHITMAVATIATFLLLFIPSSSALSHSHMCEDTLYPDLCLSTLSSSLKTTPRQSIAATLNLTAKSATEAISSCSNLSHEISSTDLPDQRALSDCEELLSTSLGDISSCLADLSNSSSRSSSIHLQTFLSAAITNQYTCLDGFSYANHTLRSRIEANIVNISRHISNSLAMFKKVRASELPENSDSGEVFEEYGRVDGGFPAWIPPKDRRLLQASANQTNADLVVAKDGSGDFTTISEAIAKVPDNGKTRFVIYIKTGEYLENVDVGEKKTNLMLIGDGIEKTVVKASRNVVDGWTTFRSATFAVVGSNFIARDMSFENSAGPSKHQAVALRSGADLSAFYRCSFVGYQDTLYVHSLRQFYRECDVYGTVDFIFGNAAVVLQDCNLYARRPNPNQRNLFTAQGRVDPNQNTGISIQNCKVAAAADLIPVQSSFKNYLGRPWKQYSRTIFMQSDIGDLIDPAGWFEWSGDFALSTLYYGEYMNRGPGADTSNRVKWPGYRVINSSSEASQFTVASFIQGNEWLPASNVAFYAGLK